MSSTEVLNRRASAENIGLAVSLPCGSHCDSQIVRLLALLHLVCFEPWHLELRESREAIDHHCSPGTPSRVDPMQSAPVRLEYRFGWYKGS